jgi:hypothetical protein
LEHNLKTLAALLTCLCAIALSGCLGGDDDDNREEAYKAPIGTSSGFEQKASLLGDLPSAGEEGDNYVPEGEIVADNGFRPEVDGFAFENYGNDVGPVNMQPANMAELFGDQVCLSGSGEDCALIPAAEEWMTNQNEGMAGGHCQGFSVTALRMYNEDIDQETFGAELTAELEIVDNIDLQSSIAEHFTYQFLPPVVEERVKGAPSEVLERLIEALNEGDELYTLGIYKPDLTGGHAITPFAVEDKGDGLYAILLYDNNFPGQTRALEVDTNEEYWSYVGGPNPDDANSLYEGNAETQTLELDPTFPGAEEQPCPFCVGDVVEEGDSKGSGGEVLPEDQRYAEITLGGDPENHPHLVFEDDQGRQTGLVDGELKQEIPDVEVLRTYAVQNWETAAEPRYRMPEGKNYSIKVDGSNLTKKTTANIDLIVNGLVVEVDNIKMIPGQVDAMALPGGYGITYGTDSKTEIAPDFFIGLVEDNAAYNFTGSAVGIKRGSVFSLVVEQEEKVMYVDSTGSEGSADGKAVFPLLLTKADAEGNIYQWAKPDVFLEGAKEEKAGFEYDTSPTPGKPIPLVILDKNNEVKEIQKAQPQEVEQ